MERQVAIITGAANGIGRAIAQLLVEKEWFVFLFDQNKDLLMKVIQENFSAEHVACYCGDATKKEDIEAALAECVEKTGRIDAMIPVVGSIEKISFLELSEEQWDRSLAVNLKSTFLWDQLAAKWMVEHQVNGSIVNIGCMRASLVSQDMAAYVAAKGGVRSLTKAMAVELSAHNINVNVVEPGRTMTDLLINHAKDDKGLIMRQDIIPLKRFAQPKEIAQAVAFLISKEARYITGAVLPVDGGYTIEKK